MILLTHRIKGPVKTNGRVRTLLYGNSNVRDYNVKHMFKLEENRLNCPALKKEVKSNTS